MKEKIKKIHYNIENIFYLLTEVSLRIISVILGITSWIYPIVGIWTDVIDGKFNPLKSVSYVLIGVCFFYVALALNKMLDKIKVEEKEEKSEFEEIFGKDMEKLPPEEAKERVIKAVLKKRVKEIGDLIK